MSAVLCFGELLLRLGAPGRQMLLQTPQFEVSVGGAEANVAVALAQFGHSARVLTALPYGPLGDCVLGELRRFGVATQAVRCEGRMGLYFLVPGAMHRPSEVLYDRQHSAFAQHEWTTDEVERALAGVDWLMLSGVTPSLGENAANACERLLDAAAERGIRIAFDGNFRSKLWALWRGEPERRLRSLMARAELLFANERDIAVVLGDAPAADRFAHAAARAFAAFPRLERMATTLREEHSVDHHTLTARLIHRSGASESAPSYTLSPIVDRIGTGDAFAAGVLHGLMERLPDAEALHLGLAAACLKHSIPGDAGRASPDDLRDFVAARGFGVRR